MPPTDSDPTQPADDAVVFTIEQAARYMQCGPKVVRRLIRLKRLPALRICPRRNIVRIHKAAVDRLLLGEKKPAASRS